MLYDGWMMELASRAETRFAQISAEHNFDLGPEFEIAVALFLREWMPNSVGVCRGFIVEASGSKAGDDVIIYDRSRFPTLRGLGDDLSRKENVPFEAVLAYIEAKHTLHVNSSGGQSLERALAQIRTVRALKRDAVPFSQVTPNVRAEGKGFAHYVDGAGFPSVQNPLYAAIWARLVSPEADAANCIGSLIVDIGCSANELPDVIAAGSAFAVAATSVSDGFAVRPSIVANGTTLITANLKSLAFGVAAAHMLWAIQRIQLGKLRWGDMIHEVMRESGTVSQLGIES